MQKNINLLYNYYGKYLADSGQSIENIIYFSMTDCSRRNFVSLEFE